MANYQLPNPATAQDLQNIIASIVANLPITPQAVTVVSANPASTNYTYVVVAKMYGQVYPVSTAITTGAASLAAGSGNQISWSAFVPPIPAPSTALSALLYDVYRTVGGATQGKILSNLSPLQLGPQTAAQIAADTTANLPVGITFNSGSVNALAFLDNGAAGDGTTPPPFNTFGFIAPQVQEAAAAGPITIAAGRVIITDASAAALTLGTPVAGSPAVGGQDGAELTIMSATAAAHTVTTATGIIQSGATAYHILTFGATKGNYAVLVAYNGQWFLLNETGITAS